MQLMSADLMFSSGLSECFAGVGQGSKWDLVPLSSVIMVLDIITVSGIQLNSLIP